MTGLLAEQVGRKNYYHVQLTVTTMTEVPGMAM